MEKSKLRHTIVQKGIGLAWVTLLLLSITPIGNCIQTQGLLFDHYAIREGLSSRLVRDITFDQSDLVWVATSNGLNRFDGYDFEQFLAHENFPAAHRLSQSHVQQIVNSKTGKLYLLYEDLYSSFDIFDPATFSVKKVEVALQIEGQPRLLTTDAFGNLYAVAKTNQQTIVARFDPANEEFIELFRLQEQWMRQFPTINLLVSRTGQCWLYDQEHGLRTWLPEYGETQYIDLPGKSQVLPASAPILYEDQQLRRWFAFRNQKGIYRWTGDSLQLQTNLNPQKSYTNIWEDEVGNLLFSQGTYPGVYPLSEKLLCLSKDQVLDFSHLLEIGEYILAVASKDFFGTSFFGTDTGLKVVQNTTTLVERYLSKRIGEDRRGASMRDIAYDGEENVYFAREAKHWYKLNLRTNVMDTIVLYDRFDNPVIFNNGYGLWYDTTGVLWGATGDGTDRKIGYLHRYDLENCTNTIYQYRDAIYAHAISSPTSFWFGTNSSDDQGNLVHFDVESKTFTPWRDKDGANPFARVLIRYLLLDGTDALWVATEGGLYWIDLQTKTTKHFTTNNTSEIVDRERHGLADNTVFALHQSEHGLLWVGTFNGLSSYDRTTDTWRRYTIKNGLAANTIATIEAADDGNLWVSTYNGLTYFDPGGDDTRSFFQLDGLTHNEFNRFSSIRLPNGRYFFGGVNGINSFYADELLISKKVPKVLLARFTHYDNRQDSTLVQATGWSATPQVTIRPSYDYFSFDFTLPIYRPVSDNQYRYRIGNQPDQEWIYLKGDRSLRYNNIQPGFYQIYVQGADPNGNWGNESLLIEMEVLAIWYQQWWFILLSLLLGGGIIYGLARYRLEEKLRIEKLRTQLASDLHDEVSGLLAGISMQSELLRPMVEDQEVDDSLKRIRQASQRAMSKMSDVIWSIDSRRDRIRDLISRMEEHADEVLLPIHIRYYIHPLQLDHDKMIPANIRQNVYFIYKEAINNVAKHANATEVHIWLGNNDGRFELKVQDNGKGKEEPKNGKKRKGQGLSNLRMRAQRLNAEIDMLNGDGFTVHLRLKKVL